MLKDEPEPSDRSKESLRDDVSSGIEPESAPERSALARIESAYDWEDGKIPWLARFPGPSLYAISAVFQSPYFAYICERYCAPAFAFCVGSKGFVTPKAAPVAGMS